MKTKQSVRVILAASTITAIALFCPSCVRIADHPRKAYVVAEKSDMIAQYAPVFVLQTHRQPYNRIGTPRARLNDDGKEQIYIDPSAATLYAQQESFRTDRGDYTNLIYRVHFERVPLWHTSAGRNVGLLFILTLNEQKQPVLLTTVHTCGCYLAFVPTNYLPEETYPPAWTKSRQKVFGEILPGQLRYPESLSPEYRPIVFVRDETHRITDIRIENVNEAAWRYDVLPAEIKPMESLKALPLNGSTTSFYHEKGSLKGYVKGAHKPLEMLFVSPWAMDAYVGRDKEFSDLQATQTSFYTSLKFWRREQSNLWHFADCLKYYGWKL